MRCESLVQLSSCHLILKSWWSFLGPLIVLSPQTIMHYRTLYKGYYFIYGSIIWLIPLSYNRLREPTSLVIFPKWSAKQDVFVDEYELISNLTFYRLYYLCFFFSFFSIWRKDLHQCYSYFCYIWWVLYRICFICGPYIYVYIWQICF